MTDAIAGDADYTTDAHQAILQAVRDQNDFGGWVASTTTTTSPTTSSRCEPGAGDHHEFSISNRGVGRLASVGDERAMISPYLTVREVALLARCEHKTVRRAISEGRLRAFRPAHRVLVREDDARDWIESRLAGAASEPTPARRRAGRRVVAGRGSVADLKAIEQRPPGS